MNFLGLAISFIGVSLVIFHRGFHLNNVNPVGILCLFVAVLQQLFTPDNKEA